MLLNIFCNKKIIIKVFSTELQHRSPMGPLCSICVCGACMCMLVCVPQCVWVHGVYKPCMVWVCCMCVRVCVCHSMCVCVCVCVVRVSLFVSMSYIICKIGNLSLHFIRQWRMSVWIISSAWCPTPHPNSYTAVGFFFFFFSPALSRFNLG